MKEIIPVLFALGTALCWGMYGPALGNARSPAGEYSPFKPYLFIGIAYLVIAIGGGIVAMKLKGDSFTFSGPHRGAMNWGFIAGCLGAFGALCLTSALVSARGSSAALFVMPIVFGGAISVNAIVGFIRLRSNPNVHIDSRLWIGMAIAAVGVFLVAMYAPHPPSPPKKTADAAPTAEAGSEAGNSDSDDAQSTDAESGEDA